MLTEAPRMKDVLKYLNEIIPDPEKVIFIGHSPKADLRLLGFTSHNYIDTQPTNQSGEPRSLKD
jgi:hypothetical protein